MTDTVKVLAISGGLRKASLNSALLRNAQELAPPGMTITIADLSAIPFYDDDIRVAGYPPAVASFRQSIAQADAILIASPEFNRSIPGVLKNAIDWASRPPEQPFAGKPVAVMGASPGMLGTAFANHHLRQLFVYLDAVVLPGPEVLINASLTKFDAQGKLTDEGSRKFVQDHLVKLMDFAKRLKK